MKAYQNFLYAGNTFQQPGDFPLPGQSLLELPNIFCCQATLQLSTPSTKYFSIIEYYTANIIRIIKLNIHITKRFVISLEVYLKH